MKIISIKPILLATFLSISLFSPIQAANNPRNAADVVARDLYISKLGWAGHVGMWDSSTSKVLEVLNNKDSVIQKNSLSSFKSKSYWGARYSRVPYRERLNSLIYGWNQRNFNPTYTISNDYRHGYSYYAWRWSSSKGWHQVKKTQRGKFRCDTFVNESYRMGTRGYPILKRVSNSTTPNDLYNALPYKR